MHVTQGPVGAIEGEQRRLVEQVTEVDVTFVADKFQGQHKWLVEGFVQFE